MSHNLRTGMLCSRSHALAIPGKGKVTPLAKCQFKSGRFIFHEQLFSVKLKNKKEKTEQKNQFLHLYEARISERAKKINLPTQVLKGFGCYHSNGFRKTYPYHTLNMQVIENNCYGMPLLKFIKKFYQFKDTSIPQLEDHLQSGHIFVDGQKVDLEYPLKAKDVFGFWLHKHEMPVVHCPIEVVYDCPDLLVVSKPASMVCHPHKSMVSAYYTTLYRILKSEFGYKDLKFVNRIDRGTSGVVIMAKSGNLAQTMVKQVKQRKVRKTYLARVHGEFPVGEITCEEPIHIQSLHDGLPTVNIVNIPQKGYILRDCKTVFQRISFNGTSSVVRCNPVTGRTHQIRVHLQFLGHPILNDEVYNSPAFGPQRAKGGIYSGTIDNIRQSMKSIQDKKFVTYDNSVMVSEKLLEIKSQLANGTLPSYLEMEAGKTRTHGQIYTVDGHKFLLSHLPEYNEKLWFPFQSCDLCQNHYHDCKPEELTIYLHALSYEGPDWKFTTQSPEWSRDNWTSPTY